MIPCGGVALQMLEFCFKPATLSACGYSSRYPIRIGDYLDPITALGSYEKEKYLAYAASEKFLSSPNRACTGSFLVYETIFF